MGVFKRLADVPDRYRLYQHANAYAGRDAWDEYQTEHVFSAWPDASDDFYQSVRRAGRRWKAYMDDRGRHHALATPSDAETWCERLLGNVSVGTACRQYWIRVEGFYAWLQNHPDHPHSYHPLLMAVAEHPGAKKIWDYKLTKGNRAGGGWNE
jgi:hypothetical protein